jgi:hypothetical protein
MSKYYVGDLGTAVIVDVGTDITGATETSLRVEKPTSGEVTWEAGVYSDPDTGLTQYLKHTTDAGSFTEAGIYAVQAKLTHSGWIGSGDTTQFEVHALLD